MLLRAILAEPARSWTRTELARVAGQHPKARMDLHVAPLLRAGVLEKDGGGAYRLREESPFVEPLKALLETLVDKSPSPL